MLDAVKLEVIVPLKHLRRAKSRLRAALDEHQRRALVRAMAGDLLALLRAHPRVASVTALVGEHWDEAALRQLGVRVWPERELRGGELNGRLTSALQRLHARRALVLHADLPRLTATDIDTLARELDRHALVICPDARRRGTNALAFRRDAAPNFAFGPRSFARHLRRARRQALPFVVHWAPGFAHDVDTPGDLRALVRAGAPGRRTRAWLRAWQARAEGTAPAALHSRVVAQ